MTLPAFDDYGNLPPGIYDATLAEISRRFAQTSERQRLVAGLAAVLDLLAECGCRHAWLDGSFITDIEATAGRAPRDFDLCWDIAGVDLELLRHLAPNLHPLQANREEARRQYGGDCFFVVGPLTPGTPGLLGFFQRDRQGRAKGIVHLQLGPTN